MIEIVKQAKKPKPVKKTRGPLFSNKDESIISVGYVVKPFNPPKKQTVRRTGSF